MNTKINVQKFLIRVQRFYYEGPLSKCNHGWLTMVTNDHS